MKSKRILCALLALLALLALSACEGAQSYRVNNALTLVEQHYSLAFRNGDPLRAYVTGALEELCAEGRISELSRKWFGAEVVDFPKKEGALAELEPAGEHTLLLGADVNSFPMAYMQGGNCWGFDVELYSGNIDVAWGGVALDQAELDAGKYEQYGPYIENDIIIVARDGSRISNGSGLKGRIVATPTTPATIIPQPVEIPTIFRLTAPAPVANIRGRTPTTKQPAVIITAR